MGRTITPTYRIEWGRTLENGKPVRLTAFSWKSGYGRANAKNLERFVRAMMHDGTLNIASATLIRQRDNAIVATYTAPMFQVLDNPDNDALADAERSGLLAQRYSEALARGSTGEAAARHARQSVVSPDREDVTERRMSETYSAHNTIKLGPSLTATERALFDKLPPELELGFVSKALLYSPAIRHAAYGKAQRTALFKLIKRGLLRVERDRRRDMEYLVKTQPNPARSGVRQRATMHANPKVAVFHANPRRRHTTPVVGAVRSVRDGRPILQSSRVYEIAYKHIKDGKAYKHPFKTGVCMELLPDGSVRIYSRTGKRLWKDFR